MHRCEEKRVTCTTCTILYANRTDSIADVLHSDWWLTQYHILIGLDLQARAAYDWLHKFFETKSKKTASSQLSTGRNCFENSILIGREPQNFTSTVDEKICTRNYTGGGVCWFFKPLLNRCYILCYIPKKISGETARVS